MPTCKECNLDFIITDEDLKFYKKLQVPKPKSCPDCRLVRRFNERNPKTLYYRQCDLSGNQTLSQFHKDSAFPVYSPENWWGDDWDGTEYNQNYDFERPFFAQYEELKNKVPHLALFNTVGTIENSDYNNCTAYLKNCYLIAESDYCEDCYYSNLLKKCTDVVDCSVCYEDELCYECVDCQKSQRLFYSQDCESCHDSYFLNNCTSCDNCIGCINQRQKKFMIFNKQYSQEDYKRLKSEMKLNTLEGIEELQKMGANFFLSQPHKYVIEEQNQNSSGDHLFNCKNAYECFDSIDLEDCRYCQKLSLGVKDSMDYNSWGNKCELIYQCCSVGDNCNNVKFCSNCQSNINDCEYCAECFSISNCFGCVGLKRKKYCILNKQYSKEEYEQLIPKIKEHMMKTGEYGEFFPKHLSPFGYNETMAMDAFPLSKNEAQEKGYKWHKEENSPKNSSDDALQCNCGKNFKIISQEKNFYEKLNIPTPKKCPLCRHKNRMAKRRPLKLWKRQCDKCSKEINSNYSSKSSEKIYCKECFLKEVY